jgi:hypothetical protein
LRLRAAYFDRQRCSIPAASRTALQRANSLDMNAPEGFGRGTLNHDTGTGETLARGASIRISFGVHWFWMTPDRSPRGRHSAPVFLVVAG